LELEGDADREGGEGGVAFGGGGDGGEVGIGGFLEPDAVAVGAAGVGP